MREAASIWLAVVLLVACGTTGDAQPDKEPYRAILEELDRRLDIEPPVAVHPLVGQLERSEGGQFDLTSFYREDSVKVFEGARSPWIECRLALSGACELRRGEVSIVLSESVDLGNDVWMVIAFVTDLRTGEGEQTWFRAQARKTRTGRWTVFRLDRL